MKQLLKMLLICITLLFISCSTIKRDISKNNRYTDKLVCSLFKENGNVFYIVSTYATFSTVWTYETNNIKIYRLAKGKIFEQQIFSNNGSALYKIPEIKELDIEIQKCGYVLDGDIFGYRIKIGSEIEQQDWPISIECFTKQKYKSDFLNKIIEDINAYKMWEISQL